MEALTTLLTNYPELEACRPQIIESLDILVNCLKNGGTVFTAGNGGSCADADHITGEMLKGFLKKRPLSKEDTDKLMAMDAEDGKYLAEHLQYGLRGISLMHLPAALTAVGNDLGGDLGQAQLLLALAKPGDVLIGITTSGNARNVGLAARIAALKGVKVIGMTGSKGGRLKQLADCCICVPADQTFRIQEYHLPVYHALCAMMEEAFFDK